MSPRPRIAPDTFLPLKPVTYQWYVWPGYGSRSQVVYGQMLGSRTFRIVG